jgi:trimeric autotransporter adhesin
MAALLEQFGARIYTENSSIFMLIRRIVNLRGRCALFNGSPRRALAPAILLVLAGFLGGCGGGSKSANNTVAQVLIAPSSASLVAGQVLSLSTSAVNSANTSVLTTFTFNSSNTAVATISPAGLVCGGVWDSTFVVCNGADAHGNPISGTAVITATAGGVTSSPVNVSVHPSVTSVSVDPITSGSCFSVGDTHQFTAHAFHNGGEITSSVGAFSWSASDATVAQVDANGLATARISGLTGIVASIGGVTSPATFFKTCLPVEMILHVAGDPAGNFTTSIAMNAADTKSLQVDLIDEHGSVAAAAPITLVSNNSLVASVAGPTLTANVPGGAGIQAVCAPPSCGNGLNTPMYSNLFSVTVNGSSSASTTVYAASTFPVPTGQIMPLVPIDISKSPPVVGAALPLPGVPNSMLFDRAGNRAYIGTNVGLADLETTGNTISLVAPNIVGSVLAVSPDGNKAIISNATIDPNTGVAFQPNAPDQRVFVFDRGANPASLTTFVASGAVAATFDDDNFRAYIIGNNGNFYVYSPLQTFLSTTLGTPGVDAVTLSSGPFVYVATPSAGVKVIATCNNTVQAASPPTNSSNIQLVSRTPNTDTIYAVDTTGINVESVAVSQHTPPISITTANCAPSVAYNNTFVGFGAGPITARQILVGSNGVHAALLPAGTNKVFTVLNGNAAGVATLAAGATEPLSGGLTPDGLNLWVGVAGSNSVDHINLGNNQDDIQVKMNFVKADGSPAPPNLVRIQPK